LLDSLLQEKEYQDIRASYNTLIDTMGEDRIKREKDLAAGRGRAETGTGGIAAETEGTEEDPDLKTVNQELRGVNLHYTGMSPLQVLNISHQCSTSPCRLLDKFLQV